MFLRLFICIFVISGFSREYYYPEIHQYWNLYCFEHLLHCSETCSSYVEDKAGNICLEFKECAHANLYIDPNLIKEVSPFIQYIPLYKNQRCSFQVCQKCNSPIVKKKFTFSHWNEIEEEWDENHILCFKCPCLINWLNYPYENSEYERIKAHNDYFAKKNWIQCSNISLFSEYFEWHNSFYFRFLKEHLQYCSGNSSCQCYWPQVSYLACHISNIVYQTIGENWDDFLSLVEEPTYREEFYPQLINLSEDFILTGLLTHAFFYSQYREILLDLCKFSEKYTLDAFYASEAIDVLYSIIEEIQLLFLNLYGECLNKHPHPKIYYERGMIYMHRGESDASLWDIHQFIEYLEKNKKEDLLTSDLYLKEGSAYAELGLYDQAVKALTEAIKKDPKNKTAYFERSAVYFELGNYDVAIKDFISSDYKSTPLDRQNIDFIKGLIKGTFKGGQKGLSEFVPSIIGSLRGLSHGLWSLVSKPKEFSQEVFQAAYNCVQYLKDHSSRELIEKFTPELQELMNKWDQLSEVRKGELTGYVIGKYGTDIFLTTGSMKAIKYYRDLKIANNLFTLEKCAKNSKDAKIIMAEGIKRWAAREKILKSKNIKIEWNKQGKHIIGHKNYIEGKSIWKHKKPEMLLTKYAGKGQKIRGKPGQAGYKEVVDFEEKVGIYINKKTKEQLITTRGTIHYSQKGIHIVPAPPQQPIGKK